MDDAVCAQLVSVPTCIGVLWVLASVLPWPSWPLAFAPHAQSVPSLFTAMECLLPPAATFHVVPGICTGEFRCVTEPSPSWPLVLSPHAHSVPFVLNPRAQSAAAYTDFHVVTLPTCAKVRIAL